MAVQNIWKVRAVVTPTPLTLGAITSVNMPVQATVQRDVTAGQLYATSGRIDFTSVDLQFTTQMAAAAIAEIGLTGACISGANYDVIVAKYECNGPAAGSVHRRYRITKGILFINSIQCDHKGDLSVTATLRAVYDGVTDPVTVVDNIPLPTVANEDDRWTLSPDTYVNGNQVLQKQSVNVDFGVNTSTQGADSDAYDTFASIDSILPVVTVTGIDPTWFDTIGLTINGKSVTNALTYIPFRKRDGAGGFVPEATAAHITLNTQGPAYYDQLLSGNGTDANTASFRIESIHDGTNVPLVLNTGVAISYP